MAGINLSQLNIPKSEEPVKRKHVIRLDELSDAYSNPEKKEKSEDNERPTKMRELRNVRGVENEPVKKSELKKPESKVEKIDKKLAKIEERTDYLIAKAANTALPKATPTTPKPSPIGTQNLPNLKRDISFITYLCMPDRKVPKQILKHIEASIFEENGEFFSIIDSYKLLEEINPKKSAHFLSKTIHRLRDEGWFEIIKSNSSGYRLLKIEISNYKRHG